MKSKQASPKNLKENEFFGIVEGSKYRKRWKRVNTVLSVAMAVITLGLLILPAITQNSGDDPVNPSAYSLTENTLSMSDGATTGNRISDPVTLNDWRKYFGADENGNISTEFAGGIRNDKSVTTSTLTYGKAGGSESTLSANPGNFLVGLSTMASTQTVAGMKSAPVDVMFVLDLSSSMYNSSNVDPTTVINMVDAVNKSITHLNELNPNNRVGVVVYYGYGYVDKQ